MFSSPIEVDSTTTYPAATAFVSRNDLFMLINAATLEVLKCDPRLLESFAFTTTDNELLSLISFFGKDQTERLLVHLAEHKEDPGAQKKFIMLQMHRKDGVGKLYYAYSLQQPETEDIFLLNFFEEHSVYDVPFISFDTRDLFLKQFNNITFGTFEWIVESNKVFWSEGIYRIYEVDDRPAEITREFVSRFTHPEDKLKAAQQMSLALQEGKGFEMEMRIITAKGNVKHLQCMVTIVRTEAGNITKLAGSLHDITRQRTIEQDLERSIEDLHRSNAELEEFAYVASHDLQEPLRKISTFCDRLADKYAPVLTDEGALYLNRIMASADNMRMLIHHLLDFSRITKAQEPFTPVNLNFILQQVKSDLEVLIEETKTVIEYKGLPTIDSSVTQMKQLFANLINNAIKFRKPGAPPHIKLASALLTEEEQAQYSLPKGTTFYKITVQDNGIGFDNQYADRIFQIFQRLHGKADYQGSGIGLAICKKIVEKHHGLVYADSEPGQGATFTLIIPEKQQDQTSIK